MLLCTEFSKIELYMYVWANMALYRNPYSQFPRLSSYILLSRTYDAAVVQNTKNIYVQLVELHCIYHSEVEF